MKTESVIFSFLEISVRSIVEFQLLWTKMNQNVKNIIFAMFQAREEGGLSTTFSSVCDKFQFELLCNLKRNKTL